MLLWWCDISLGLVVRVHTQFQVLAVFIHATEVGIGCKHMCNVCTGSWNQDTCSDASWGSSPGGWGCGYLKQLELLKVETTGPWWQKLWRVCCGCDGYLSS